MTTRPVRRVVMLTLVSPLAHVSSWRRFASICHRLRRRGDRMKRRQFIALFAAAVASRPVITLGQVSAQRPLIAVLLGGSQAASQHHRNALRKSLQKLGYREGREHDTEYRSADGDVIRQPVQSDEVNRPQ